MSLVQSGTSLTLKQKRKAAEMKSKQSKKPLVQNIRRRVPIKPYINCDSANKKEVYGHTYKLVSQIQQFYIKCHSLTTTLLSPIPEDQVSLADRAVNPTKKDSTVSGNIYGKSLFDHLDMEISSYNEGNWWQGQTAERSSRFRKRH